MKLYNFPLVFADFLQKMFQTYIAHQKKEMKKKSSKWKNMEETFLFLISQLAENLWIVVVHICMSVCV